MLVAVIIACEIGFWIVLGAGLATRYVLRRPRAGAVLLVCVPLVDVLLLIVTVLDLQAGGVANWKHGLAAIYIGFSVAFGHSLIRWADAHFAYRFAGGPTPIPAPKYGADKVRYEWQAFAKTVLAWAIACGLSLAAIWMVGDPSRTETLSGQMTSLTIALAIYFVAFPLWITVFPPKDPAVGPQLKNKSVTRSSSLSPSR